MILHAARRRCRLTRVMLLADLDSRGQGYVLCDAAGSRLVLDM